jgi:hypothetical protein
MFPKKEVRTACMHFGRQSFFFARSLQFAEKSSSGASCTKRRRGRNGFSAFNLIGGQPNSAVNRQAPRRRKRAGCDRQKPLDQSAEKRSA